MTIMLWAAAMLTSFSWEAGTTGDPAPPPQARSEARCMSPSAAPAGMAITEEGGNNQHADRPKKPAGQIISASGAGGTGGDDQARHAINTKGTGAAGKVQAPSHSAPVEPSEKYSAPINITSC